MALEALHLIYCVDILALNIHFVRGCDEVFTAAERDQSRIKSSVLRSEILQMRFTGNE